jgi:chorismate mutase
MQGFEKDKRMDGGKLCRGVRGATTVESNSKEAILKGTRQLLALMIRRNDIAQEDVASAIFTVTKDLNAEFPALAARQMGWIDIPLLCGYEVDVPGSLGSCVRILLHWNTAKSQKEIHHVYIHDAVALRPDLSKLPPVDWNELEEWITTQLAPSKSNKP